MKDLFAALCLLAVLEGLMLFAAPMAWKRMVEQLLMTHENTLRTWGGAVLFAGLAGLWWVRH